MVSTNILVEVEDNIYSMVVLPHKKSKTFSKLVAALIQGYVEDEYIRSYIEGNISEMQKAAVNSLDDVLNNMTQSLANIGLYTGEMQATSSKGMQTFNNVLEKERGENGKQLPQTVNNNAEVEELKEDISMLKKQNEEILTLLRSGSLNQITENKQLEVRKEAQKKEINPINLEIEDFTPTLSLVASNSEGENNEPEIDAAEALSNLLVGNSYSF